MTRLICFHLFLLLGSVLQIAVGQVTWQNPVPLGSDLCGIFFLDTLNGWCAGSAGAVVKTSDGGTTWAVQESNTDHDLGTIQFPDQLHGWAGGDSVILSTTNGGANWHAGDFDGPVRGIFFSDPWHGWVLGANNLVRTSNGGQTWTVSQFDSADDLRSMAFPSLSRGWVAGTNRFLKTSNGGATWIDVSGQDSIAGARLTKVLFANEGTGWLFGTKLLGWGPNAIHIAGLIWKTTDAGETWNSIFADSVWFDFFYPRDFFLDAVFADSLYGFFSSVVGAFGTSDGGLAWQPAHPGPGGTRYAMPGRNVLYTAGRGGMIAKSTDKASSWEQVSNGTLDDIKSIQFFDRERGIAAGSVYPGGSAILRSTDGGRTWIQATSFFDDRGISITGMKFADSLKGWVSAVWPHSDARFSYNSGLILGTTDGGLTWTQEVSDTSYYRLFDIHFLDDRNGLAVGSGEILRTTNGGASWSQQFFGFGGSPEFYAAFLQDSLRGWAGGLDRLYFTQDGGHSWEEKTTLAGLQYYSILDLIFSSSAVGWIAGYDWTTQTGFVLKTTDDGQNWQRVLAGPPGQMKALQFPDDRHGWAVGDGGILASTLDGGTSWEVKPLHHVKRNLQSLFFLDDQNGWIGGEGGTIVHLEGDSSVASADPQAQPVPGAFRLLPNYPNPFNPSTTIRFELPVSGPVSLVVYNILGSEVATLLNERRSPGSYEVLWHPRNVPSGVYFYRLSTGGFTQTRAMMLLR